MLESRLRTDAVVALLLVLVFGGFAYSLLRGKGHPSSTRTARAVPARSVTPKGEAIGLAIPAPAQLRANFPVAVPSPVNPMDFINGKVKTLFPGDWNLDVYPAQSRHSSGRVPSPRHRPAPWMVWAAQWSSMAWHTWQRRAP